MIFLENARECYTKCIMLNDMYNNQNYLGISDFYKSKKEAYHSFHTTHPKGDTPLPFTYTETIDITLTYSV